MKFNNNGCLMEEPWIGKTVIESVKQLTYDDVEERLARSKATQKLESTTIN